MSNRVLIYLVILIIILAGGVLLFEKTWLVSKEKGFNQQGQQSQNSNGKGDLSQQSVKNESACQRNFDENKLKTAKVDIKNRMVEIQVENFGTIGIQLYDQDAPKTVENFLRLVNAGYYDCLTFHRVAKGFVIQGGDPTGSGSGGDSAFGKEFADELNPQTPSFQAGYKKGVVAMANRGPNTNTSQFFIMLEDAELPHNYTIFGKVATGLDVVEKIGNVPITPVLGPQDGKPQQPVVMQSVKIIK